MPELLDSQPTRAPELSSPRPALVQTLTGHHPRAYIEAAAVLHPSCRIDAGAWLASGTQIGENTHVQANCVFLPAAQGAPASRVERDVTLGANSVIEPGLVIGAGAVIRPGSLVTRSIPPGAIVGGNPAIIVGYVNALPQASTFSRSDDFIKAAPSTQALTKATGVRGVTLHSMPVHRDIRGDLTVGEFERDIPFTPQRYFIVFDVPNSEVRGEHAHHTCQEFLICLRGRCSVMADDGFNRTEIELNANHVGVYLPAKVWRVHFKYTPDAVLLVFASQRYDPNDYIRDYADFARLIHQEQSTEPHPTPS